MPLCDGREGLTCALGRLNASADSVSSSLRFRCGMTLEIGNIRVSKVFYGPKLIPNALSVPSLSPWLTTASLPPGACLPPSLTHCHSWVRLTATHGMQPTCSAFLSLPPAGWTHPAQCPHACTNSYCPSTSVSNKCFSTTEENDSVGKALASQT